jgi:hypothetical protein
MSTTFSSFPITGKKSNEVDIETVITGDEIIFISDPVTGKIMRTTYATAKDFFTGNISPAIVLPAGTSHFDTGDNAFITAYWFQGGNTAADIGIGTVAGQSDLFEPGHLPINGDLAFQGINIFRTSTRIYFNGIASDTVPIIYKY